MIRKYSYLFLMATLPLFAACSQDEELQQKDGGSSEVPAPLRIGAMDMPQSASFALCAWIDDAPSFNGYQSPWIDGAMVSYDANQQAWTATSSSGENLLLWRNNTSPHYFLAYSPADLLSANYNDPYYDCTVELSDDETSYDYLMAQTAGIRSTDNNCKVSLNFKHMMAKLVVNLMLPAYFEDQLSDYSFVVSATTYQKATFNFLRQDDHGMPIFNAAGMKKLTKLYDQAPNTPSMNRTYSRLLIPQSGVRNISVAIIDEFGTQTYRYAHPEDIPLQAGKVTTVNLLYLYDVILVGTVTLQDWVSSQDIETDVEE